MWVKKGAMLGGNSSNPPRQDGGGVKGVRSTPWRSNSLERTVDHMAEKRHGGSTAWRGPRSTMRRVVHVTVDP